MSFCEYTAVYGISVLNLTDPHVAHSRKVIQDDTTFIWLCVAFWSMFVSTDNPPLHLGPSSGGGVFGQGQGLHFNISVWSDICPSNFQRHFRQAVGMTWARRFGTVPPPRSVSSYWLRWGRKHTCTRSWSQFAGMLSGICPGVGTAFPVTPAKCVEVGRGKRPHTAAHSSDNELTEHCTLHRGKGTRVKSLQRMSQPTSPEVSITEFKHCS